MASILLTTLAVAVALSPIILIHEFGHFIACRMTGIRVNEFAFGMGKILWSVKKGDTLYSVRIFPFGGFVSPAGEMFLAPDAPEPKPYEFAAKPWYIKLFMVVNGAFMNYVLAFILFTALVLTMGKVPTDLKEITPVIDTVAESSAASKHGLMKGDTITMINAASITYWPELTAAITGSTGDLTVNFIRDGEVKNIVIPAADLAGEKRMLGVTPAIPQYVKVGFIEAVGTGAYRCWFFTKLSIVTIYDSIANKKAPELAGPVGIVNIVHNAVKRGFADFVFLVAILSLAVGMFNLFPIPVLDGGYALMYIWEGIFGKQVSEKFVIKAVNIGFVVLMLLVVYATQGDIRRIFFKSTDAPAAVTQTQETNTQNTQENK
ncbi:regulator of sigma E protease [Parelusimicrobium proximum]|uniref:M50 family metallopeptidase n=1 Tax=Parelusimicrobium proximum TaxID=3228953 RepID=UPI003D1655E9